MYRPSNLDHAPLLTATLLALLAAPPAAQGGDDPPLAHGPVAVERIPSDDAPTVHLPAIDAERLRVEGRLEVGMAVELHGLNSGRWSDLESGDRLWRLRLEVPGATSLSLDFHALRLPAGAALSLRADDGVGSRAFGAEDNPANGRLVTAPLAGDALTLEYVEPRNGPRGVLAIGAVVAGAASEDEGGEAQGEEQDEQDQEESQNSFSGGGFDLVAKWIDGPTSTQQGNTISMKRTIESEGFFNPYSFAFEVRLSKDTTIDESDYLLTKQFSTIYGTQPFKLQVPANAPPGTFRLGLRVLKTPTEIDLTDNVYVGDWVTIHAASYVDLVAKSLHGPTTATAAVGASVKLTRNVESAGTLQPSSFQVKIRLSADSQITASDHLVSSFATSIYGSHEFAIQIPPDFAPGLYRLGMTVVAVGEKDASDDTVAGDWITIESPAPPPAPDLVAKSISTITTIPVDKTTSFSIQVDSVGSLQPSSYSYEVRLSKNATITSLDELLFWGNKSNYAPFTFHDKLPAGTVPGTYRLGLVVMVADGETNVMNNIAVSAPFSVKAPPPDLVAKSISGPWKVKKGKKATLYVTIDKGDYSGGYQYEIRLSKDKNITPSDTLIGTVTSSLDGWRQVDVKVKVPKGKFYWGLIVKKVSGEIDGWNNVKASSLAVKVKKKKS